jgi:uronate dehydrogenase
MASRKPLLLTGAAGKLGSWLRPHLATRPEGLRSSDIGHFGRALEGEEIVIADLSDADAVQGLVSGASSIVHFGAVAGEDSFERVLKANILGTFHVFDAARRHGVKRIVYGSSVHVVGFYPTSEYVDGLAPLRPDSLYAVSKAFGENLARLYVDKAHMDIACLRIGVALPEPKVPRNLWTWLSIPDLVRLVTSCLDAPPFGFTVVYGISDNRRRWWSNAASRVNFDPKDDAERYAPQILANAPPIGSTDVALAFHGGPFVALDFGQRPA